MKIITLKRFAMLCMGFLLLNLFSWTYAKEKVLVIGMHRDPEILDSIITGWNSEVLYWVFERLVTRDREWGFVPNLAESWKPSEDGKVWTFFLRKNVKFHSGKPLVASDVKWTFDRLLDPKIASPNAGDYSMIEKTVVVDDHTVNVHLKYPFPNILFNLSNIPSSIVNPEAYAKYGDDYGIKYIEGTGAFRFVEWKRNDRLVVERNPDYQWAPDYLGQGPPVLDKIIIRTIPEESTRMLELMRGGIHIIDREVPPTFLPQIKANPDVNVVQGEATKLGYLAFATDKKPYTDVRVRRAINHAIDKESIVKFVFRGLADVAHGYIPRALKNDYYPGTDEMAYKFDKAKAKELLAEAGYPDGFSAVLSAQNNTEHRRVVEVLQDQLKQVGIQTQIRLYDTASYKSMLKEGKQELFLRLYSWPDVDILDWFLLSRQIPYPNHSRWNDKRSDELILGAGQKPTLAERSAMYKEAQKYLIEQAVWAPIWTPKNMMAYRSEVINFQYHPWHIFYNNTDLKVD